MAWRPILLGAFSLAALDTVLSLDSSGQGLLNDAVKYPGRWARAFMSPAVPLIPDLRKNSGAQPSSSTGPVTFQPASLGSLPPPPATPIVKTATT